MKLRTVMGVAALLVAGGSLAGCSEAVNKALVSARLFVRSAQETCGIVDGALVDVGTVWNGAGAIFGTEAEVAGPAGEPAEAEPPAE